MYANGVPVPRPALSAIGAVPRWTLADLQDFWRSTGTAYMTLPPALDIYDRAVATVAAIPGDVTAVGGPRWRAAWIANGEAWSNNLPLIFPDAQQPGDFPYSVATYDDAGQRTSVTAAPGETPFDRCAEIRQSAERELFLLDTRTGHLRDSDPVGSTGITRAQMRTNIMREFNATATLHGCTEPFPGIPAGTPIVEGGGSPDPNTLGGDPISRPIPPAPSDPTNLPGSPNTVGAGTKRDRFGEIAIETPNQVRGEPDAGAVAAGGGAQPLPPVTITATAGGIPLWAIALAVVGLAFVLWPRGRS